MTYSNSTASCTAGPEHFSEVKSKTWRYCSRGATSYHQAQHRSIRGQEVTIAPCGTGDVSWHGHAQRHYAEKKVEGQRCLWAGLPGHLTAEKGWGWRPPPWRHHPPWLQLPPGFCRTSPRGWSLCPSSLRTNTGSAMQWLVGSGGSNHAISKRLLAQQLTPSDLPIGHLSTLKLFGSESCSLRAEQSVELGLTLSKYLPSSRAGGSVRQPYPAAASSPAPAEQCRAQCAVCARKCPAGVRRARERRSVPPAAPQWQRQPPVRGAAPSLRQCGKCPPGPEVRFSPPQARALSAQSPARPEIAALLISMNLDSQKTSINDQRRLTASKAPKVRRRSAEYT